jgi:hypothetical protein
MAKKNAKTQDGAKRIYKGTTSRQRERLKGGVLLLLIPLAILIAALARGVEPHDGEVPDWRPAPAASADAH